MFAAAMLALALAGQASAPRPEIDESEAIAVGERVVFSPGNLPDADKVTHVATVEDLRWMKRLEAYMAHRIVKINLGRTGLVSPEVGTEIVPVPIGTPGHILEIAEAGGWTNDARAARVRIDEGPLQGRALWVRTKRLARVGPRESSLGADRPLRRGDRAVLDSEAIGEPIPALVDRDAFSAYIRSGVAHDERGILALLNQERLVVVAAGTGAVVVERHARPGSAAAVEVRLTTGPYRGRTAWIPEAFVKPSADPDDGEEERQAEPSPSSSPDPAAGTPSGAEVLLARALELERQDRTEQALGCYREILARFPDSREAVEAAKKVRSPTGTTDSTQALRP